MKYPFLFLIASSLALAGCGSSSLSKFRSAKLDDGGTQARALVLQPGGEFGKGLTSSEQVRLATAESRALDYGKPGEKVAWEGDRKDVSGYVEASQPYQVGQSNCRRFTHDLLRKGVVTQSTGTACRKEGGQWQLIS